MPISALKYVELKDVLEYEFVSPVSVNAGKIDPLCTGIPDYVEITIYPISGDCARSLIHYVIPSIPKEYLEYKRNLSKAIKSIGGLQLVPIRNMGTSGVAFLMEHHRIFIGDIIEDIQKILAQISDLAKHPNEQC